MVWRKNMLEYLSEKLVVSSFFERKCNGRKKGR